MGKLMNVAGDALPSDSEMRGQGEGKQTRGNPLLYLEVGRRTEGEERYRRLRMGKREFGAKLSSLYTQGKPVTQPSRTFLMTHTPHGEAAHQPLSVHQ